MTTVLDRQTYLIPARLGKALKAIRAALAEMEVEVIDEIDSSVLSKSQPGASEESRILLVDNPLLAFEAVALDRSSAVFFPLHLMVRAAGEHTRVTIAIPATVLNARLPPGAADPMRRLEARVVMALEFVSRPSDGAESGTIEQ